ncbi:DUF1684 domain-containing protein [Gelidibacter salicanalis]|uniref:DUF1684 domain-containing protein n=1 Tax=Gelidibacter salicanalis TaxID=291193 RepID=A0A934NK63_9FLAO|nr:DUF1684 domain-containing protein [Gelidibacter salicanalis]MBJ7879392.1 DUF1684 domain-containing protein [Gelidibacter salicanalis]
MKTLLSVILGFIFLWSCTQKKQQLQGDTEFQRELNAEFKDASKSPLKDKDRRDFKGLEFFEFDSTYVVSASFKRTEDEKPFKMKTTTDRLATYVKYGEVSFTLNNDNFQLNVYQDQDLLNEEEFEDYLFLPFLDDTNGEESYGAGRYIDLKIPADNQITIDFNTAYNPYCAYNEKYSCPIVPRENYVDTEVRAGVKDYKTLVE